jgi:hypothetical protein
MKSGNDNYLCKLDPLRLVGVVTEIKCKKCKHIYIPDNKDISLNGSLYYKLCKPCRAYLYNFYKKKREAEAKAEKLKKLENP